VIRSDQVSGPAYDVLVVGPNAAVDTYYSLETLSLGQVNRVHTVRDTAGGKANNLARALQRLGGRPLVVGIAAGQRGDFILSELAREGLDSDYVRADGNSRLNTTLLAELARATTVLLEPGQPVAPEALEALSAKVAQWAPAVGWVVLTGSLPAGAPPDLYARLVSIAASAGARVAVDASGAALRLATEAGPDLVKVNLDEFDSAFPGQSHDWGRLQQRYRALADSGLRTLCLTAGARGALVLSGQDQFRVRTDVAEWVSAVGAGDTFLAGLLHGLGQGAELRAAAQLAAAAAAANLQVLGCGFIEREQVERFLAHTRILEAEPFTRVAA
jgi:tagatose 6-phosphate kinase